MGALRQVSEGVFRADSAPAEGALGALLRRCGAEVICGHPTYGNAETIGPLLAKGIGGARESFGGRPVAFVVVDGTLTEASGDRATLDAAEQAARAALDRLDDAERALLAVVLTPYEGSGADATPGKGSALKLLFDEMGEGDATMLVLLDGDLRNDVDQWHRVFAAVEAHHLLEHPGQPMFVTARYARHFVDASLTRFIVGPLTTLMGTYVPGGISGDIALSATAVARERAARWTSARRRYGTDIATTFDNLADPATQIYEVYLGAKLHDITDEAKLSAMPGQVIGAALERLLHWEEVDGRVTATLRSERPLGRVEAWGPERTGIGFVDPGATDAFDVNVKLDGLVRRFGEFADDLERVVGADHRRRLGARVDELAALTSSGDDEASLRFLGVDSDLWVELLGRAVAHALSTGEVEVTARALNYLYTAAFLEFVRERLVDLGLESIGAVRRAQGRLGVPPERAERFYADRVDALAEALALRFFERRGRIAELLGSRRGEEVTRG